MCIVFYAEEPSLLVSEQYKLLSLGLRSFSIQALITPERKSIFSLDYDRKEKRVYWVSLEEESIKYVFHGEKNNIGTIVKGKERLRKDTHHLSCMLFKPWQKIA